MMTTDIQAAVERLRDALDEERMDPDANLCRLNTDEALAELERLVAGAAQKELR